MQWEATDQFGNLYVGVSEAADFDELRPHLASMIEELLERAEGEIILTLDMGYGEIVGPEREKVSHVLQIPQLLEKGGDRIRTEVESLANQLCQDRGWRSVSVVLGD